jgi:photosynthetic reaction center cytochrome c subunit
MVPLALAPLLLLAACERTVSEQRGPRGTAEFQLHKPSAAAALVEINKIPPPEDPADTDSPSAGEVFKNVQVLNDLSATEISRLMQALSTWVAPDEGCDFCHNPDKLESDEKYPKRVARRMLQMTRQINTDWKDHVGTVGVTCWTCHRGQAVPTGDWFKTPATPERGFTAHQGEPGPAPNAGRSALPHDPLSAYLSGSNEVRIQATTPLVENPEHSSALQSRSTYALMMYMSGSLGVNCTYCHNTRAFARWEESTPQRVKAWHGIRMVRTLNNTYLASIQPLLPAYRLSAEGDGPKVGCATCHKGTFKPLNGVTMLTDYPVLAGVVAAAPAVHAAASVAAR